MRHDMKRLSLWRGPDAFQWLPFFERVAAAGLSRKTIGRPVTSIAIRNEHERSYSQA
jgi:hypothetical protein